MRDYGHVNMNLTKNIIIKYFKSPSSHRAPRYPTAQAQLWVDHEVTLADVQRPLLKQVLLVQPPAISKCTAFLF